MLPSGENESSTGRGANVPPSPDFAVGVVIVCSGRPSRAITRDRPGALDGGDRAVVGLRGRVPLAAAGQLDLAGAVRAGGPDVALVDVHDRVGVRRGGREEQRGAGGEQSGSVPEHARRSTCRIVSAGPGPRSPRLELWPARAARARGRGSRAPSRPRSRARAGPSPSRTWLTSTMFAPVPATAASSVARPPGRSGMRVSATSRRPDSVSWRRAIAASSAGVDVAAAEDRDRRAVWSARPGRRGSRRRRPLPRPRRRACSARAAAPSPRRSPPRRRARGRRGGCAGSPAGCRPGA